MTNKAGLLLYIFVLLNLIWEMVLSYSVTSVNPSSVFQGASSRGLQLLLIQCQFSLGCCFTCLLAFLHQGAPHSTLSLSLAAALSWALAGSVHGLWSHAAKLYPLHSTQRYCGKCMTLLTSGHSVLASLQTALVLAFAVANVASLATVYDHFLSEKDALRFWTPLTLCYAMLVVCIQGEAQWFDLIMCHWQKTRSDRSRSFSCSAVQKVNGCNSSFFKN